MATLLMLKCFPAFLSWLSSLLTCHMSWTNVVFNVADMMMIQADEMGIVTDVSEESGDDGEKEGVCVKQQNKVF